MKLLDVGLWSPLVQMTINGVHEETFVLFPSRKLFLLGYLLKNYHVSAVLY